MTGERVLITGMGGELGTRVAQLIEQRSWAGDVVGVDFVPPRRRLRRAVFHRIDPRDRDRLAEFVEDFAPSVVAHFGVYEPASRMSPMSAVERTELCTIATMSAAARAGNLEYVVVRSGLEVYGPLTARASVPDEDVMPEPRTPYGRSLLEVESIVAGLRLRSGVPVCALRYAPVVGPHVPSPVGRLLRLPIVPVPTLADPPFSLLHPDDAAEAMVAAIDRRFDGPLNVVGPGAATPWQAVRLGGRVPLPVFGPLWDVASRVVELAGAAVAPHVIELLRHGRTGAGELAVEALGLRHIVPTQTVLRELFEWADVIPIPTSREAVASSVHAVADRDRLDVDHIDRVVPFGTLVRRRLDGRYPIDPFGFDPQIVDLVTPVFTTALRVEIEGGEHVPASGPAVLVANRGFGIIEPAVLGIAVRRVVARRLRIVGAPGIPAFGGLARRLGAISASAPDMRACLRAGNLVAVPLAPTWLRRGAGIPPRPLLQAMTNAPIVPVAVTPGGPFGTALGPWRVRFGPLVTLPDPYDPGDPLAAARFGEAVRDAVSGLLERERET